MRYIFSWGTTLVYSLFLIFISLSPVKPSEALTFPYSDKVFHFLLYALLSFLVANTFSLKKHLNPRINGFLYSFVLGSSLELIQFFLPYRYCDLADFGASSAGAILGILFKII